ncbi:MAG: hypothetical protein IJY50_00650 [Clostridia bacterium]|nr:hypothetical protein [Clostridia bacterium]
MEEDIGCTWIIIFRRFDGKAQFQTAFCAERETPSASFGKENLVGEQQGILYV